MLRLSIQSWEYIISVENYETTRSLVITAKIPDGIWIEEPDRLQFFGPVYIAIRNSEQQLQTSRDAIYLQKKACGTTVAHASLHVNGEIVDRIADKAKNLATISLEADGCLVNGGHWTRPQEVASVSCFSCRFSENSFDDDDDDDEFY